MDYTILYLLGLVLAVVLITILTKTLRSKNTIQPEDLEIAMALLDLTSDITEELQLGKEKKLKTLTNIVITTVDYVKNSITEVSKEQALEYAKKLCEELQLELSPKREEILSRLLDLSLSKLKDEEKAEEQVQDKEEEPVIEEKVEDEVQKEEHTDEPIKIVLVDIKETKTQEETVVEEKVEDEVQKEETVVEKPVDAVIPIWEENKIKIEEENHLFFYLYKNILWEENIMNLILLLISIIEFIIIILLIMLIIKPKKKFNIEDYEYIILSICREIIRDLDSDDIHINDLSEEIKNRLIKELKDSGIKLPKNLNELEIKSYIQNIIYINNIFNTIEKEEYENDEEEKINEIINPQQQNISHTISTLDAINSFYID